MKTRLLFVSIITILLFHNELSAYSTEVHKKITEEVIKQNENKINKYLKDIGLNNGVTEYVNNKYIRTWIEEGSWKEDFNWSLLNNPLFSHFYNPLTNRSGVGLDLPPSAYEWANASNNTWSWKMARENFYKGLTLTTKTERDKALAKAFEGIGHVMHLEQDVGVPAHARGNLHVSDPYEKYTNKNIGSLSYASAPFQYWNVSISPSAPKQFWDLESYNGSIPYGSGYIGLAEYTNANFASSDTIFSETLFSFDSLYFPFPRKSSSILYEGTNSQGKKTKYFKIIKDSENIEHFAVAGRWYDIYEGFPNWQRFFISLDDKCHDDYQKKLIPHAVGYSAGLLNYFFRGEMDMVPDDTTGSGYVIVNNSDEDMSGTFELWYDNKDDERVKVSGASWTLNINKKSSGNNKSTNITFTPPTNAKEPDKYMLAFRGKLGNEEDSVVGKEIMLMPLLIFLHNGQNTLFMTFDKNLKLTPYPPFTLAFGNAGLSGIETTPATIQSNETFTEHYYMPSTTRNKKMPSSYFQKYSRLYKGIYLLGNRNSFTHTGWDKNSPLEYNTDLSYLSYPTYDPTPEDPTPFYVSSGRHDWAYSGDNVIKNLEVWKEADNKFHIRYTTKDGVIKGDILPFSDVFAVLSPTKVIGISSNTVNISNNTATLVYSQLPDCGDGYTDIHDTYGNWANGYEFHFGDVILGYSGNWGYRYHINSGLTSCDCWPGDAREKFSIANAFYIAMGIGDYVIKDYDNINEDETFIVIYTRTGAEARGTQSGHYRPYIFWDFWPPYTEIYQTGTMRSYYIAYRLNNGYLHQEEIALCGYYSESITTESGDVCGWVSDWVTESTYSPTRSRGQAVFNPSTKIFDYNGKTYIAYSYSIYDYIGDPQAANFDSELLTDWRFNKRIGGLIDADTGQKSETEINDSFLADMYKDKFDETLYSAIGFHNGSIKK